jgi:hypothetical protein
MKIIDSQRNVRASLTKPVKSGTEKHEFGAPNSYFSVPLFTGSVRDALKRAYISKQR